MTTLPTCVVVDDHMVVREGLRARLESQSIAQVVGDAASGEEGVRLITSLKPDIAFVDVRMPGMSGYGVVEAVAGSGLPTRIIAITALSDRATLERLFEAGAYGYIGKESRMEILAAAVQTVVAGRQFIDPAIAAQMLVQDAGKLTARERRVLELLANGATNTGIAYELGMSEETVKTHVSSILRKLDVSTRTGAVATAFRRGLVE